MSENRDFRQALSPTRPGESGSRDPVTGPGILGKRQKDLVKGKALVLEELGYRAGHKHRVYWFSNAE